MIGIETAVQKLKMDPTKTHLEVLSEVPFAEEVLQFCKDSHVLIPDFGFSIVDLSGRVGPDLLLPLDHNFCWYKDNSFAKRRAKSTWRLVRNGKVPLNYFPSEKAGWEWQFQELIPNIKGQMRVRAMVCAFILYHLIFDKELFDWVHCKDVFPPRGEGHCVCVGGLNYGGCRGLHISSCLDF